MVSCMVITMQVLADLSKHLSLWFKVYKQTITMSMCTIWASFYMKRHQVVSKNHKSGQTKLEALCTVRALILERTKSAVDL